MNRITDLSELYQLMPGWVHIHRAHDLSLISMNETMRNDLQIEKEDIPHMRHTFLEKYLNQKSYYKVTHLLNNLCADGIYEQVISYFSNFYYDEDIYRWYFTSSRFNKEDGIILSMTFPIEKIFENTVALVNMLENDNFNRDKIGALYNLTIDEKEILRYLASGFSNREISALLTIPATSVKKYQEKIHEKLQINNKANLIKLYSTICA
jgi:DNA-binding CsgD family transcriptional regulator